MSNDEFRALSPSIVYQYVAYHGRIYTGYPEMTAEDCFIVQSHAEGDTKIKINPAIIQSYRECPTSSSNNSKEGVVEIRGEHRFKTLVIVGAGASFDYSYESRVIKPPQVKDLFNDSYTSMVPPYKGVQNLNSQLLLVKDIESYFQLQWNKIEGSHNPILLQKIIDVQYYLQALFYKLSHNIDYRKNNYIAFFQALRDDLISKGEKQKALIVTFNYDTILEQSLKSAFDYSYSSMNDYINLEKRFLLFKPHGSHNWVRTFSDEFSNMLGLTPENDKVPISHHIYNQKITLSTILSHLDDQITIDLGQSNLSSFPQLLIPYKQKDAFVMPTPHTTLLEHFMGQVEKIIILGWKGAEESFKTMLSRNLGNKKVNIICVTAKDKTVEKELKEVLPEATFSHFSPYEVSKGTFTELNSFIQEYPENIFN